MKRLTRGGREVIEKRGLLASLYSDRGSHYWHALEAGGKLGKKNLTQLGQAMKHLGIEVIAAYSPEARGAANRYLKEVYLPAFNLKTPIGTY